MKHYGTQRSLELMGEAVDIFAHGEAFHHEMMLWCQAHGFQGHKRLHRYNSSEDRRRCIEMQNYALDMFGETLRPKWNYSIHTPDGLEDYLEDYLAWEVAVYENLSQIVNALVLEGCQCEADMVKTSLPRKEIEKVRRMLTEYALSGWDRAYILERDKTLHDKMKESERE